jgi:hypothetical protein
MALGVVRVALVRFHAVAAPAGVVPSGWLPWLLLTFC